MGSGDPMFGRKVRLAALAGSSVAAFLLVGCSAADQSKAPSPPPSSDYHADRTAPELMGAPPPPNASQAPDGLLGGPPSDAAQAQAQARADAVNQRPLPPPYNSNLKTWRRADGSLVTAMSPIANPKGSRRVETHPRRHAAPDHRVQATLPTTAAPAPRPAVVAQAKPAPVAKPVAPKTVAPAPAPLKAAVPAAPATPLVKPPVVATAQPEAPAAAKPTSKLEQLQAAVAPQATSGAVLAAGESLSKGQPGQVTLSLPATLGDLIKSEAAKLGFGKAAKKTSAYAELSGEGYEVTPNGRQTAAVKPGEPTTFAWDVKPGPDAKGQLKSQFGVEMSGAKDSQGFALGEISKRVAAAPEQVKKGVAALDLGALNGAVTLPGVGPVAIKTLLGAGLVLLAMIILVAVARGNAEARRRAERQRKYRTLTDYGRNEMEFEQPAQAPAESHGSHVNPFLAAAGGAAVGAAAASAFSHHDDHGHAAEDHGHAAAPEAHPEPHASAEPAYVNPMIAAATPDAHDDHGHDAHGRELEPTH